MCHVSRRDDLSRAIDDPVIAIVASEDPRFPIKIHCWDGLVLPVSVARLGMQKYGANFGIRLHLGKRAVCED